MATMVSSEELEMARAKRELEVDMAVDKCMRLLVDLEISQKSKVIDRLVRLVAMEAGSWETIQ
jgi:hypothetical protein